jgi:protoporphyrinogen/coproporphyrinogen III oxidase
MRSMRVAVIGGGISGLSAAFELEKARAAGHAVDYILFEQGNRLGGCIYSETVDNCVVEGGPDSFLTEKPAAIKLCQELGIDNQLVGSDDASRKTYILLRNKLVPLPDGLMFMVPTKLVPTALSSLFSLKTKLRMAAEFLRPPRPSDTDESVAELVTRHYGSEVVERLTNPLLSGIYGGDSSELSARAVLPRMVEMERQYGSLTRGMLAVRKRLKEQTASSANMQKPRSTFTSLRGGMRQLIDALEQRISPERIYKGTPVHKIEKSSFGWILSTSRGTESFDAILLALPSWTSGSLLREIDPELSQDLCAIPYSSSITVTLIYRKEQVEPLPPGFGFLVPSTESIRMMACTFTHRKIPRPGIGDKAILRCFLGGVHNHDLLNRSDLELETLARKELQTVLSITSEPEAVRIYRWNKAMAQYTVGHKQRVERIIARANRIPGLALAGNAFDGIGVPDCIRSGQRAVTELLKPEGSFSENPDARAQLR